MKKALILGLGVIALTTLSFTNPPNPLVGHWQQNLPNGVTSLIHFRADNTFDTFINGKAVSAGRYYVRKDTAGIQDPLCHVDYFGTYRLIFFAKDSVRFAAIKDTCNDRQRIVVRTVLGRVTSSKP